MTLATQLGAILTAQPATLATAESCTGGLIGHWLTDVAGSSAYYMGGVVAYSNAAKMQFLGVQAASLELYGAVSAEVAAEMAQGARERFGVTFALSVTGIAGPGGGSSEKPVGLTYLGLATPQGVMTERHVWPGSREANKESSAQAALQMLLDHLGAPPPPQALAVAVRLGQGNHPEQVIIGGQALRVTQVGRQWAESGDEYHLVYLDDGRGLELRYDGRQWWARRLDGQAVS
jgi:PncC family amidohydrolase